MNTSRRRFLKTAGVAGAGSAPMSGAYAAVRGNVTRAELDRILDAPVLQTEFLKQPVHVASIELLKNGRTFMVRTRSREGIEAITVPNSSRMADFQRTFLKLVPVFLNQDARRLEPRLWDAYRHDSNYKLPSRSWRWPCSN